MTFGEIVQLVLDDLLLTSDAARDRVKRHINQRYRELAAKPWLQISRRGETVQPCPLNSRYMTWPNCTKIYSVFDPLQSGLPLNELSFDEMRNLVATSGPPQNYAIARQNANTVTIFLDCVLTTAYSLSADVEKRTVLLETDTDTPKFDEDFHMALYYGAKNLELLKMEKGDLAEEALGAWNQSISDLKYKIASTAYLNYQQGKDSTNYPAFVNTIVN